MSSPYGVILNDGVNILRKPSAPAPDPEPLVIEAVNPSTGAVGDAVTLTITGLVEDEVYTITFGDVEIEQEDWVSVDWNTGDIVVLAPANSDGPADLKVTGPDSEVTSVGAFTYTSD